MMLFETLDVMTTDEINQRLEFAYSKLSKVVTQDHALAINDIITMYQEELATRTERQYFEANKDSIMKPIDSDVGEEMVDTKKKTPVKPRLERKRVRFDSE